MARYEITNNKPVHTVVQYPYTIDRQKQTLMLQLAATGGRLSFSDVIRSDRVKMAVVYNFLAILDLLQLGQITLRMGMGFNNFWIEKPEIIAEGARKYVR
jgi:segregation and condensation protein A